jgi:hypothetical protein
MRHRTSSVILFRLRYPMEVALMKHDIDLSSFLCLGSDQDSQSVTRTIANQE